MCIYSHSEQQVRQPSILLWQQVLEYLNIYLFIFSEVGKISLSTKFYCKEQLHESLLVKKHNFNYFQLHIK